MYGGHRVGSAPRKADADRLLADLPRKNRWSIAERGGDADESKR